MTPCPKPHGPAARLRVDSAGCGLERVQLPSIPALVRLQLAPASLDITQSASRPSSRHRLELPVQRGPTECAITAAPTGLETKVLSARYSGATISARSTAQTTGLSSMIIDDGCYTLLYCSTCAWRPIRHLTLLGFALAFHLLPTSWLTHVRAPPLELADWLRKLPSNPSRVNIARGVHSLPLLPGS